MASATDTARILTLDGLASLIAALRADGREVIGPRVRDGVITLAPLEGAEDLPAGWTAEQQPGGYRLTARDDAARFGYAVGPDAPKRWLLPPRTELFTASGNGQGFTLVPADVPEQRLAFVGIRPCELAGIAVQDRVFIRDDLRDVTYASRREDIFTVVVHCGEPAGTCFCASVGTGPRAETGFDLALTEVLGATHHFVVEVGSAAGADLLEGVATTPASAAQVATAEAITQDAAGRMGRELEVDGLREDLLGALDSSRYRDVARRCLACGNCTFVCPTCFCTGMVDSNSLDGSTVARERVWNSCFTEGFSYIHGGSIRPSVRARYRQWLTHKLATWQDQFDTLGCVGCGRCITWCPVGIDLTEEARAIRATAVPTGGTP